MAPPAGQIRPGRYLAFFLFILLLLYTLVFATGNRSLKPKLGIDLQGGTRVTLTARTETGEEPEREALQQARQIIENRVNGLGVAGTEVVLDGNNLIITVPGEDGQQARDLGQTAQLRFRSVVTAVPNQPTQEQPPAEEQPSTDPSAPPTGEAPPATAETPPPSPAGRPAPAMGGQPTSEPAPPSESTAPPAEDETSETQRAIEEARAIRQAPTLVPSPDGTMPADQAAQQLALASLDCSKADPLVGQEGAFKYILGPAFLQGTDIEDATSQANPEGTGYVVSLDFESRGGEIWGDFTTQNVGQQAAFVLDSQVVSAPEIQEPILGGQTMINGGGQGGFSASEAKSLAEVLKYGSLPLSFESSEAETVSASLGLASLQAGLIAGAIGLVLVFLYCMIYYRMLGLLTILSLVLSGAIVFAVLILLGRWVGFTLDLAGVAGFIVAIGITADSFVIFFERLKDEIREGRTFRSAVPRAWVRARRTILSADAVMFLAAGVLYLLAVGQVRGFAFTLGMSTVLDLIVVFLVTHPLVALASKSKFLSNPRFSGLGAVQREASERRSGVRATGSAAVAKEV